MHKQINVTSGIYQTKCLDSPLKYIDQSGRTFSIRFKEHIYTIRNNSNSGYSNHILNTGHAYGTITDTMDIVKRQTFKCPRKISHL
jgi:hypothetical protein